jgi:hypothetical protein
VSHRSGELKTTIEYLDAIKSRLDLPSDYAAAKALGVTRAAVSNYRNGKSSFDDCVAIKAAELLNIEPMEVIAACHAESARDAGMYRFWENVWGKAIGATAAAAVVMVVGLTGAPTSANAAELPNLASIYLM